MKSITGIIVVAGLLWMGCAKEYSIEGQDPVNPPDTIPPPVVIMDPPPCASCSVTDTVGVYEWNFLAGSSFLCGKADTAIMAPERNAFTFFGPSSCSIDTGLVMSVYLEDIKLNRDMTNLPDNRAVFYYYDRVGPSYIYMSQPNGGFTVTIETYHHQTRIATGTFRGNVMRTNGRGAAISSGKFKVKLI